MGDLKVDKSIIYESPDNGKTVYARYVGESDRWLVGKEYSGIVDDLRDTQMWHDIRKTAETNESLKKILNHAILIYQIIKDNGTR